MTSILVDARLSWASGIGRYVANTLPLVAADMPEIAFDLLVTHDNVERARGSCAGVPNIAVTSTDMEAFTLAEQWRVRPYARRHDLTWFTNYWVPLSFRAPFVVAVHDMLHQEPALFPASFAKRVLSRRTFAHVARHASAVMYGSRFTQREFERRFGVPRASAVTSYGIDHRGWRLFDAGNPPVKARHLLLVAAPKQHKNFEIAVQAFVRSQLAPGWTLTLILPQKDLRSSIDVAALVRENGSIEVRTALSNDELRAVYEESAILLMPSFYEGFGLPLAEGLQAGALCISSTAESLVELAQGASVTWVNPRDLEGWVMAIEDACSRWDAGNVDRGMLADNMRHAASFRWRDVAERTSAVIDRVLCHPSGVSRNMDK